MTTCEWNEFIGLLMAFSFGIDRVHCRDFIYIMYINVLCLLDSNAYDV